MTMIPITSSLRFVVDHLPAGLVGLLYRDHLPWPPGEHSGSDQFAHFLYHGGFSPAFFPKPASGEKEYRLQNGIPWPGSLLYRGSDVYLHNIGNSLIEAVNILGSLFYGVILGFSRRILLPGAQWQRAVLGQCAGGVGRTVGIPAHAHQSAGVENGFLWLNRSGLSASFSSACSWSRFSEIQTPAL